MVDVIIVNWNTKDLLKSCLETLLEQSAGSRYPFGVIVVDNASIDGSAEMVRGRFPTVRLIVNEENLGFAKANNQAIRMATRPYVFLLNSDTESIGDVITPLVDYLEANPEVGMVGCRLLLPDGSRQVGDAGYRPGPATAFNFALFLSKLFPQRFQGLFLNDKNTASPVAVDWVSGAALMVRREAIDDAGPLAEDFFMYAEDVEWGIRFRDHGWAVHYLPAVPITHVQGGSAKDDLAPSTRWLENLYAFTRKRGTRLQYTLFGTSMSAGLLIRSAAYAILSVLRGGKHARKRRAMFAAFRKSLSLLFRSTVAAALLLGHGAGTEAKAQATDNYQIGVYYFPGWTESPGEWWNPPWDKIRPYAEREPLIGHYPEGTVAVAEKHLGWMADHAIDFVVYDWYWTAENRPKLDHALTAYLQAGNRQSVPFALLWANHIDLPTSREQFQLMVDFWISSYFREPSYLRNGGKPVVYIFSPERLRNQARKFGATSKDLLELARGRAAAAGLRGIHFVACTQAIDYWVRDHIPSSGYDAVSAYNYHAGYSGQWVEKPLATTFAALANAYLESWYWILANSKLPYYLPITAGWDSRPWGSNTEHDNCRSTPDEFERHLVAARDLLDLHADKTARTAVICAWNEFGEGSYIEPTKRWGFAYLERVRKVFGGG